MRRVLFALALGLFLLASACTGGASKHQGSPNGLIGGFSPPPSVTCPLPVIPAGTYATTIPASKAPGLAGTFAGGQWTWAVGGVADFHCLYRTYLSHMAEGQVNDIEIPVYSVSTPNRIVIHWCCSIPDGTYEVSVHGDQIRLKKIHDAEGEFAAILATEPWTKQSGAS